MSIMRIDKFLSNCGIGSRNDVKKYLKQKKVCIDGNIETKSDIKIDTDKNQIFFNGKKIEYKKYTYIMMNKPKEVISSTFDKNEKTIIDLLDEKYKSLNLFPVGRLDKDTTGLIILTNDGNFAHNTLSPKKHVDKTYYAEVEGKEITYDEIEKFKEGIIIDGGYKCKSSKLEILNTEQYISKIIIEISEGKYHQIKRMFESIERKVISLKRIKFGEMNIDNNLHEGQYREFTENEIKLMKKYI